MPKKDPNIARYPRVLVLVEESMQRLIVDG
jgi:hypothetical protein